MDASHFVWATFLGYVWCLVRLFVPAPAGRKRYNVLGALNAVTHEVLTVTNDETINAWSVIDLFFEIRKRRNSSPISVILDNAGYQRCYLVQDAARLMGIDLVYLPPYSPNLNLIERFWKFVKKNCLYSICYENFEEFKQAIWQCVSRAHIDHRDELATLLSHHFQVFKKPSQQAA